MAPLAAWPSCSGRLSFGGSAVDVECAIEFTSEGEIHISPSDIPLHRRDGWLLDAAFSDNGEFLRLFDLAVRTSDGDSLGSDSVYVVSAGTPSTATGTGLRLQCRASTLDLVAARTTPAVGDAEHQLLYHTVGMLGFGNLRRTCEEGEVIVGGPHEEPSETVLSGYIQFRRAAIGDLAAWFAECDARTLSILRVMSFGLGRPVDWAVREHWAANERVGSRFFATGKPLPIADAAFSHLSLEPVLDLALAHHDALRHPTLGLGEAIDWLVPWHVLAEIRLLTAATAFEGLLAGHQRGAGGLVARDVFRNHIRPRIEAALTAPEVRRAIAEDLRADAQSDAVEAVLAEMGTKIAGMNQRSLATKLQDFLAYYDVPLDDLPVSVPELLKTRNRVVHGADTSSDDPQGTVTARARMMREVLRRTILAMLRYSGQFQSHLNGPRWVPFRGPPNRTA